MEPLLSKTPIMVVEGNHEVEEQGHNKTFEAYKSRFAFPSVESGSYSEFYYSFNAGGIHLIMLGPYISFKRSSMFPKLALVMLKNNLPQNSAS
jgi:acid phosphatase type 7